MRRRKFIALLGGAAALPLAARAQATPVIGFVNIMSPESIPKWVTGFRQGLKEMGFVEGQNVAVEYRWAHGQYDRLPELVADLVRRKVTVLAATGGDPSPQVAKAATQTIPIVFTANGDPVSNGLVASLNRPGGNATGITIFGAAAVTKRLQLLHELVPRADAIAYLMNPNNPNADIEMSAARTAAISLGKELLILRASSEGEIETAFGTMTQQRRDALLVASDTFFISRRDQITSLAARHRMPAIYYLREFAEAGGLITYGNVLPESYYQVGLYVGRILKGEKPGDLPIQQATKFELVINIKTAKALELAVPNSTQLLADDVLE